MKDPVTFAVAQCPFLAKVAAQNGNEYARNIAINPTEVAGTPEGPDSLKLYEASFQLFHGPSGIVPLVHSTNNTKLSPGGGCPFHAQRAAAAAASDAAPCVTSSRPLPRPLPLATISLSFGSGVSIPVHALSGVVMVLVDDECCCCMRGWKQRRYLSIRHKSPLPTCIVADVLLYRQDLL